MMEITEKDFCEGFEAQGACLVTLRNRKGCRACFTNYGARWVGMSLGGSQQGGASQDGSSQEGALSGESPLCGEPLSGSSWDAGAAEPAEVVLGFDTLRAYMEAGEKYHGAIVGRVCGRIGGASFELGGRRYRLVSNDVYGRPVKNHLHGGVQAFHNRFWETETFRTPEGDEAVAFSLCSRDGEEGYPGNLRVRVTYTLRSDSDTLVMECRADTDRPTVVNLTNHAFFNLAGHTAPMNAAQQRLTLAPGRMAECDEELIPTGVLTPVAGTYADFTAGRTLAEAIAAGDERVRADNGFTIAYALDGFRAGADRADDEGRCRFAARLEDAASGRSLEIFTDQPSVQVYNGYFMDGSDCGHGGVPYFANAGIAIEPQGFPDAPNRPEFPSIAVDPEHSYRQRTEYVFKMR